MNKVKAKPKAAKMAAASVPPSRAVSFRLPESLIDALDAAADRHGIKRNNLVKSLLTEYTASRPSELAAIAEEAKRGPELFK